MGCLRDLRTVNQRLYTYPTLMDEPKGYSRLLMSMKARNLRRVLQGGNNMPPIVLGGFYYNYRRVFSTSAPSEASPASGICVRNPTSGAIRNADCTDTVGFCTKVDDKWYPLSCESAHTTCVTAAGADQAAIVQCAATRGTCRASTACGTVVYCARDANDDKIDSGCTDTTGVCAINALGVQADSSCTLPGSNVICARDSNGALVDANCVQTVRVLGAQPTANHALYQRLTAQTTTTTSYVRSRADFRTPSTSTTPTTSTTNMLIRQLGDLVKSNQLPKLLRKIFDNRNVGLEFLSPRSATSAIADSVTDPLNPTDGDDTCFDTANTFFTSSYANLRLKYNNIINANADLGRCSASLIQIGDVFNKMVKVSTARKVADSVKSKMSSTSNGDSSGTEGATPPAETGSRISRNLQNRGSTSNGNAQSLVVSGVTRLAANAIQETTRKSTATTTARTGSIVPLGCLNKTTGEIDTCCKAEGKPYATCCVAADGTRSYCNAFYGSSFTAIAATIAMFYAVWALI